MADICFSCPLPDCDEDSPDCPLIGAAQALLVDHGNCKYPHETVVRARQLKSEGLSYRQVGEAVGAHPDAVASWCLGKARTAQRRIKRAPTGHRCGESHVRVKHPDDLVRRARELREKDGLGYHSIAYLLDVSWRTVADWVNYRTRVSA